ncbi:cation-transporting atpase 4 [Fusarium mundagurra]|uniref:Cation-transporting atpase 4 n=1 Tax=Fusarium mundagurra TaxID=1567541 RepID=A0A8H5Y6N6_9HYPO|nr:cation-transporting atpase 4 [Fusarium mundagurra]
MQTVQPRGDGMATFVLTIIMLVVCLPTVAARFIIRLKADTLGIDDWLMGLGMVMTTSWSGVLVSYCFSGGGYDPTDPRLPDGIISQALKFYFICQSVYCPTTVPIKVSICAALLRIGGTVPVHRWSLIAIMVVAAVSGIGTMIGIVASCSPPSAFWDPSTGVCNAFVNTFAAYFISACSILTDFALAILPAFMLWKIQLRRSIKVSVAIILGFAAFASSATIVRLRYLLALLDSQNFLLGSGKIAVWTVIELGIGIFAGSLPALRPLLRFVPFLSRHQSEDASHKYKRRVLSIMIAPLVQTRTSTDVLTTTEGTTTEADTTTTRITTSIIISSSTEVSLTAESTTTTETMATSEVSLIVDTTEAPTTTTTTTVEVTTTTATEAPVVTMFKLVGIGGRPTGSTLLNRIKGDYLPFSGSSL